MSLGIDAVQQVDAITIVRVHPRAEGRDLDDIAECWRTLQADPATLAVAVLSVAEDFSAGPTETEVGSGLVTIAPKSVGFTKPFGVGLRGVVVDYALQLVGEADTVIATPDTRFADTTVSHGRPAIHAGWLRSSLPDAEINRLALLGEAHGMTAPRAVELGLVDEIVEVADLEPVLLRRLLRYCGS